MNQKRKKSQSGQILIEYILLLLMTVSIAMILTKGLVGRRDSAESSGVLIKSWHKVITAIGNDLPDCTAQTDFKSPSCP